MEFLAWFENTLFSVWIRESPLVFPTILILHAFGMALLVGINTFIGLSLLGVVPRFPRALLFRFAPLMWTGFALSLISGLLLLAAYPAKALTNPVFFVKVIFIAVALLVYRSLHRHALDVGARGDAQRRFALLSICGLLLWFSAITAGRFLAYTNTVLLASHLVP